MSRGVTDGVGAGEHIVKLGGSYFLWSPLSDAPTAGPFDAAQLEAHLRDSLGGVGLEDLADRLKRVDATGTSAACHETLYDTVGMNRAGPDGACISLEQLEAWWVRGEAPRLWVFEFAGHRAAGLSVVARASAPNLKEFPG